ncbi:MAG: sulfite exporter TauE/SafE family protein [Bacteroidales bacterium]|nr:sulfite exporter TauE/SafE family protein [Bacteroidales bacterium]
MSEALILLVITAASIGFFHTLTGPDHYVPFIVMSKARKWSLAKTIWITILCGIGHVGSSVIIGLIGIATGIVVAKLEFIEGYRGNIAAWIFILFGLVYFIWGLWKAYKNKPHKHFHIHDDNEVYLHKHSHEHSHDGETHHHTHKEEKKINLTPWVLFTVFVFGPCEPLIPILMYPAAQESISGMLIVTIVFSFFTIATMLTIVLISLFGFNFIPMHRMERYMHAIAGGTILICGLGIEFLGL